MEKNEWKSERITATSLKNFSISTHITKQNNEQLIALVKDFVKTYRSNTKIQ